MSPHVISIRWDARGQAFRILSKRGAPIVIKLPDWSAFTHSDELLEAVGLACREKPGEEILVDLGQPAYDNDREVQ